MDGPTNQADILSLNNRVTIRHHHEISFDIFYTGQPQNCYSLDLKAFKVDRRKRSMALTPALRLIKGDFINLF